MGRSDHIVFAAYRSMVADLSPGRVAFLGAPKEDAFTSSISGRHDFYDLQLGNWNINWNWALEVDDYDLIVCTRCACFARDPQEFLKKCFQHLRPGGRVFVDWLLGDHWRFPMFKVGWVRDGEHEWAYSSSNLLHSCMWRPEFIGHDAVMTFWKNAQKHYLSPDDLDAIVRREVPALIDYPTDRLEIVTLWEDMPQLYIMTLTEQKR